MRFGLDIAQQRMPWSEVAGRAQFADDLGFDGIWGFDHFQPMYGEGPGECFEASTTLAAWSGITERVRLGVLITGMTYRHPAVYAAEAITIDHASGGRLELAYGAAWFDKEHTELGIPFPATPERFALLEDALEILTRLFTGDVVQYDGRVVSLHDAQLRPLPVQRPHPPIWIGGHSRAALRRTARYGDGWHPVGAVMASPLPPQEMRTHLDTLKRLTEAEARDFSTLTISYKAALYDVGVPSPDGSRRPFSERSGRS